MAVEFFLKLDGITGESQVAGHVGEIQLSAYNFSGSNASSVAAGTGGSGVGKVSLGTINVTKQTDSASVKLFLNLCKGTHIATGLLSAIKSGGGGKPYLTLQLTEVFITSFQLDSSSETPVERLSLSFRSIQVSYFAQNPDGTMVAKGVGGWDVARNAAL